MTKIYLIRHGETVHNIEERISGQTETNLTEKGIQQALTAGEEMYKKGIVPDVILCSPLSRAVQTAKYINQQFNSTIVYEPNLKEYSFGDFEGVKISEFKQTIFNPPHICGDLIISDGAELRKYHDSTDKKYNIVFYPNGESKNQAVARFKKAIVQYINNNQDINNIVVVAHGAIIRFFLSSIAPDLLKNKVKNCEIYELYYTLQSGFYINAS